MMKRRTLQACVLKHCIKNRHNGCFGQNELGGSPSPPSLLGYVLVLPLKTSRFWTFSEGIEMENWAKMG